MPPLRLAAFIAARSASAPTGAAGAAGATGATAPMGSDTLGEGGDGTAGSELFMVRTPAVRLAGPKAPGLAPQVCGRARDFGRGKHTPKLAFRPRLTRKGVVACKARVGSNQNLRSVSETEADDAPA